MKKIIDIHPLKGIDNLLLGADRKTILELIGNPEDICQSHGTVISFYWDCQLKICFDEDQKVAYLEISGLHSQDYHFYVFSINVFQTTAYDLIPSVVERTGKNFYEQDAEIPYGYIFHHFELSFWREYLPEDIEEEDIDVIGKSGKYFDTVGIGIKGYYRNTYEK